MSEVFFVGCGPGDPELITVKAKKLIQKADIVVYSGSLIPDPILKLCKKGKLHDAAKLVREEIFDLLYKNAKKDKLVVSCLLYTSPSPRDGLLSRMPSSA